MKKRYLLFAGNEYYATGGAYDFKGSFDSIDEAIRSHNPNEYKYNGGWANIFDLKDEKIVMHFSENEWGDSDKYHYLERY